MSAEEQNVSAEERYSDIIDLPHRVSPYRRPMARGDRAAQFAPFAALTGFDAVVDETARLTEGRVALTEDAKSLLDQKLRQLAEKGNTSAVRITYFSPDSRKEGGAYVTVTGRVKEIDTYEGRIVMEGRRSVPLCELLEIEWD